MNTHELTEKEYEQALELLYDTDYRDRFIETLNRWKTALVEAGYTVSGPHDLTCDEYQWYINVEGNGLSESVDVTIELSESLQYEGSTSGATFGIRIVAHGGRILGGIEPYNWTPECWVPVDRPTELSERLAIVEQADAQGGVYLIDAFAER